MTNVEQQLMTLVESVGGEVGIENQQLDSVHFNYSTVDDEQLKIFELGPLPYLKAIDLSGTCTSDRGLSYLAKQQQLEVLRIGQTRIHGAGLKELELPLLKTLYLRGCKEFGLEGATELAKFQSLEELWLSESGIGDDCLAHVGQLGKLKRLWLDDSEITDRGLISLHPLLNLEVVSTGNTAVTNEGLNLLFQKLPLAKPGLTL